VEASDRWFKEVDRLNHLKIRTGNLNKQFGLKKEDCAHTVKNHYRGGMGNPRDYNYEEALHLLEGLL
jgi:hypothetical protein